MKNTTKKEERKFSRTSRKTVFNLDVAKMLRLTRGDMKTLFFPLFMLFAISCMAQDKKPKISFFDTYLPSFTADFQALKYCSARIGFGAIKFQEPHSGELLGSGIIFNNEFTFKNANKNFVYSPQAVFFLNYSYFYAGVIFSYHTDFKNGGTLQFAPEIGLGAYIIFITYSRNISITKNNLIPVNKNNISLKLMLPLETFF